MFYPSTDRLCEQKTVPRKSELVAGQPADELRLCTRIIEKKMEAVGIVVLAK